MLLSFCKCLVQILDPLYFTLKCKMSPDVRLYMGGVTLQGFSAGKPLRAITVEEGGLT